MPKYVRGVEPVAFYIGTTPVIRKYLGAVLIWDGTRSAVAQAQRATATATARPATGSASASGTVSVATGAASANSGTASASASGQAEPASASATALDATATTSSTATATAATATAQVNNMTATETFDATANAIAASGTAMVSSPAATGSADASGVATPATATAFVCDAVVEAGAFSDATAATATAAVSDATGSASVSTTAVVATASAAGQPATGSAGSTAVATTATASALVNNATGTAAAAAVSVIGVASASGNGATLSPNKPTGTLDGHWMVAFHANDSGAYSSLTAPAGWTLLTGRDQGASEMHVKVWTKTASGEGSSYSFGNGSEDGCVTIVTLANAAAVGSWTVATPTGDQTNSSTRTSPTVTGGATTGAVLISYVAMDPSESGSLTHPTGMTEIAKAQSRSLHTIHGVAVLVDPPTPTGVKTWTCSASNYHTSSGGIGVSMVVPGG